MARSYERFLPGGPQFFLQVNLVCLLRQKHCVCMQTYYLPRRMAAMTRGLRRP